MPSITFFSADPGNHRFIQPIIDRLSSEYECRLINNYTHTDADIYWFDFCDNNLISATREDAEHLKGKKVIARLHSVEAYMGYHNQIDWSGVDDLIFVSEHMKRKCSDADYKDCRLHVVHNGVDLSKFTFRPKPPPTDTFAYVGNIIPQKGLLTFATLLPRGATWHVAGLSRMHGREGEFWELMKATRDIREEGPVEDVNAWLDEKHPRWLVQPSYSESFSLIIAEAMAKGIKPIINDYVGAVELWPEDLIYTYATDLEEIMAGSYEPEFYRTWVAIRYDIDKKVAEIKDILHGTS